MIKLCRIDDRLIHGQVVTAWVNVLHIEQIIVVDEETSKDKMQQSILKMSAPPNIKVHCFSVDSFIDATSKKPITRNTMLLFKTSTELLKLIQRGFDIKEVNIGGMRKNDQRTQYTKSLSLDLEERNALEYMLDHNVDVSVQLVPKDAKTNLREVLK